MSFYIQAIQIIINNLRFGPPRAYLGYSCLMLNLIVFRAFNIISILHFPMGGNLPEITNCNSHYSIRY